MRSTVRGSAAIVAIALCSQAHGQVSGSSAGDSAASTVNPVAEPKTDTAASTSAPSAPANQLGDIIVTAQRRSENLQRAAIPVDVLSAQSVLKAGATDPTGLGSLVPALSASPNGGGTTSFFIRGVGNFSSNPLFDPSIAFNYDDIYIGRATATAGLFYDLERIEVLKGPQGTLYGRNATGGAVNVDPVHPKTGEFSGYLTGSYGNYNAGDVQGAVNVPIGSDGAFRLSGTYDRHDGYLSDGTSDEKQGGVRAQLLEHVTPALTIRIAGDYEHIGGSGVGTSYANGLHYNPATNSFTIVDSGLSRSTGLYDPRSQDFRSTLADTVSGRYLAPLDTRPYIDNDIYGFNAEISYDTGFGKLTIIPEWRRSAVNTITDGPGFEAGLRTKDQQDSVEVRFAGNRLGIFDYTFGGLYYHEHNHDNFAIDQQATFTYQDDIAKTDSYAGFARLTAHLADNLRFVGGVRYTKDDKSFNGTQDSLTIVCVAPVPGYPRCPTAPLLPFTWAISQQTVVPLPAPGQVAPIGSTGAIVSRGGNVVDASLDKGKFTYHGGIEFDVGPRSLLYANFETGFRSGGFSLAHGYETYQPEYITAYTIGSKNRFFSNRLQVNLEGFYWKYRNQQLAHIGVDLAGQNSNFTQNIGRSTIYGVDAETRFLLTPTTALNAQVQYLHTRDDKFAYQIPSSTLPPATGCAVGPDAGNPRLLDINCAGKPGLNAPRWTVNMGADQTFNFGDYKAVASVDTQYRSSRYVGFEYQLAERQKPTWQTNLQVSFGPKTDRWSVAGFVRNLENDRYVVNAQYFLFGSGLAYLTSPPRTYGVRASVKF